MRILILLLFFLLLPVSADTLEVGDVVPDFSLVDQNGDNFALKQYRGKVVLVTFLYTQCPFPEKCPMISSKLGKTRKLIESVTEGTDKLQVISITIDPENDTPEALKAYSQGMEREVPNWAFLTGSPENVARIASQFGVLYWDEKGVIEHNMRTIVIDQEGRINLVLKGSDWKAGQLAAQLKDLIQ